MTEPGSEITQSTTAPVLSALRVPAFGPMAEASARDRLIWPISLLAAVAAHAALMAYVLTHDPDALAGGGGQELAAISVTIVSSAFLELRDLNPLKQSAPAAADLVEPLDGNPDAPPASIQPEPKNQQTEAIEEQAKDAIFEAKPKTKTQPLQPQNSATGGPAARADADTGTKASGPASASPGAIREYARYVSAALAKTKPKGVGGRGTVKIKLIISANGALSFAEVLRSSGERTLDLKALEAVRHTVFPPPPRGMTATQLTYEVPYHFR